MSMPFPKPRPIQVYYPSCMRSIIFSMAFSKPSQVSPPTSADAGIKPALKSTPKPISDIYPSANVQREKHWKKQPPKTQQSVNAHPVHGPGKVDLRTRDLHAAAREHLDFTHGGAFAAWNATRLGQTQKLSKILVTSCNPFLQETCRNNIKSHQASVSSGSLSLLWDWASVPIKAPAMWFGTRNLQ